MKAASCLLEVDFHDSAEGVNFIVGRRADAAPGYCHGHLRH